MKSYITMYENEERAVELLIRDQDDVAWTPDAAYFKILSSEGPTVVTEGPAMVTGNTIYALVTTVVTQNAGEYDIVWRIVKEGENDDSYTFYHKTRLVVEEL